MSDPKQQKDDEQQTKTNNKGRRQRQRDKRKEPEDAKTDNSEQCAPNPNPDAEALEPSDTNDLAWYTKYPRLTQDAASVAWAWVLGKKYSVDDGGRAPGGIFTRRQKQIVAPGVCALYLRPSLPRTNAPEDVLNASAMKEFAFLRATVSNKLPYDAPELIMDQVAIANAISYCNFLARVYMVAFLNNNDNRYTPRTLMSCMGVDYDSIMASLANFRYGINLLIQRISSLAVPKDVTYFAREAMIYANIYQDGTSIKDQMYLYVPESFFRYSDNADGEGTPGLTLDIFNDLSAGPEKLQLKTANQLIAYGNKLISGLFNSEAIATIAANITRAYGDSGIITMNYLEEGARIVPIFDIVVLEQMKNADVLPPTLCFSGEDGDVADQLSKSWTLTQAVLDNNDPAWWLKFNPVAGLTVADDNLRKSPYVEYFYMADSKKLITTTTGYTDAGVTIENTRLKTSILCDTQPTVADPNWDIKKQGNIRITVDGAAEVVVACTMIRMKDDENILSLDGNDFCDWYNLTTVHAYNQLASADFVNAMQFEAIRRSFTFAPNVVNIFTPFLQTESNLRSGVHAVQWDYDMDNYAIITNEELIRLHETCMYSMMDVPGVAKPYYGG